MKRVEWEQAYASRLVEKARINSEDAAECAKDAYENYGVDFKESPEEAADEEMSYWDE